MRARTCKSHVLVAHLIDNQPLFTYATNSRLTPRRVSTTMGFLSTALVAGVLAAAARSPSLGELALDKILQDSSQLFGNYQSALKSKSCASDWMQRIPDDTQIVHMNIPGTHDSGSWNLTTALMKDIYVDNNVTNPEDYQCQNQSMAAMLEAGIRFFDLRPALDPTQTYLTIWHGPAEASQLASVEDLMFAFYAWLDRHPSETLLLSFEYEGGTVPGASQNAKFEQVLFAMLTSRAAKKYIWQESGRLGTLGDVRGKIILFKRFDIHSLSAAQNAELPGLHLSPNQWTDNGANISFAYNSTSGAKIYVEDHYDIGPAVNVSAADNIGIKVNDSIAHLDLAAHGTAPDSLFITFLSSEHVINIPSMTPKAMALGLDDSSTPKGGVNQQVVEYFKTQKGKRRGIVVADFFGQPADLVDTILH